MSKIIAVNKFRIVGDKSKGYRFRKRYYTNILRLVQK